MSGKQESCLSLSRRLVIVNLRNEDGQLIYVIGAHLHYKAGQCEARYALMRKPKPNLPLAPHVVMLAHHDSMITQGLDSQKQAVHDDLPAAAAAKEQEVGFLSEMDLGDAWDIAYSPTKDPEASHIPKGWTWGFHIEMQQKAPHETPPTARDDNEGVNAYTQDPHRRQIDKVHLSQHILPSLTLCYTHFLVGSDHKAVIVTIPPLDWLSCDWNKFWHCVSNAAR